MTPYYEDESVRIFHADCRDVLPTLDRVDHVLTDPPYEAEAHTLQRRVKRNGGAMNLEPLHFAPITVDRDEVALAFGPKAKRWTLVFCQAEASQEWRRSLEAAGLVYRRACIWVKPDGMPQFTGDRPGMGYETFTAMHAPGRSRWNAGGRHGVYTINKGENGLLGNQHPTQKPLALMKALIEDFTDQGETILDPFAGSGTTGRAAKDLGRKAILIEREEKYCEIAAKRMSQSVLPIFEASHRRCDEHGDYWADRPTDPCPECLREPGSLPPNPREPIAEGDRTAPPGSAQEAPPPLLVAGRSGPAQPGEPSQLEEKWELTSD